MEHGVCHLCGEESALVSSHIFPEFFYESTYDQSGRFLSVTNNPRQRPRLMQKGLAERLLCVRCDGQFSRYESYAASLLRWADATFEGGSDFAEIADADFTTFRLFGLSLLWRAHVARAYMFGPVDLGPHGERVRGMLEAEAPGAPHEYGFVLVKVLGLDTHGDIFVGPARSRYRSRRAYRFMARGYEWVFVVARDSASLQAHFPFVGSTPALLIPGVQRDKRELFRGLRRAFPKTMGK